MPKTSAGLLAYRHEATAGLQVLLVHPGGPFYTKKDLGAWSIPKGEYVAGEDALTVALREFTEETGNTITSNTLVELLPVKLASGKVITAWAVEHNFDRCFLQSNTFSMEWPPNTGKMQTFEEVDKGGWFSISEAQQKLNKGQLPLLQQLIIIAAQP